MILVLINNKGGTAKTTTAVNLSAALATKRRRVLLVDLDGQGSASLSLGVGRNELSPSAADVLLGDTPLHEAIRPTSVEGLALVTGSIELANADLVLAGMDDRENRLKVALDPIRDDYSFIVLDCPPSLSLLSVNALVAAERFIVPVLPHYLALEGLVNLLEAVERIEDGIGEGAALMGILLTLVDYRTRVTKELVSMIRGHYGRDVFKTEVRVNVRLSEAPSFGQTIFEYDHASTGADAYRRLANEVLRRAKG